MARRFGRNFDNPERRIESVESNVNDTTINSVESDVDDDFDRRLDILEKTGNDTTEKSDFLNSIKKQVTSAEKAPSTQENAFLQEIKVEQSQEATPLMIAYRELDTARRSRDRASIIRAEDRILDLERQEEEREYTTRIAELKRIQQKARESGNSDLLAQFKRERQKFVREMNYDELKYKLQKLQNSQRLEPSNEKIKQIVALRQELDALELEESSR